MTYSEDNLVQKTTADYLKDNLGWNSVYAFNQETYGENSTLGRKNRKEVILTRILAEKLRDLNPNHPDTAYDQAIAKIIDYSSSQTLLTINREKDKLLRDGVSVEYQSDRGETVQPKLIIFDFANPKNNHFLAVRELWIEGAFRRQKRADLIGFVNGIPLIFIELKNIHRNIRAAYEENYKDYLDTIPHLFHHNALVVLGNGDKAKLGSLNSPYEHFHDWKRLAESDPGIVDMETLLKGVFDKKNLLDIFENFIIFDDSSSKTVKIVARNHQYLGVNQAIAAVKRRYESPPLPSSPYKEELGGIKDLRKLGVFWHTQGSGKSYSMVFFARKIRRKLGANYTFLMCSDREDLDQQIYKTFAGCGLANNESDPCRPSNGEHLKALLKEHKAYLFTLIHKFNQPVSPETPYNVRDDIIVISDEAHRSQYGTLSLNLRNALPNASFIGFTGTPLFTDDEITRRYFGDYVSTYDFQRAVEDNATVPLYYDPRGDKLEILKDKNLNDRIAAKLEELELEDADIQRIEKELGKDYRILISEDRLEAIAKDFVHHYATSWEMGKAMFICLDKVTCGRMYEKIDRYWQEEIKRLEKQRQTITDQQEAIYRDRQIQWMQETIAAVVISHEQNEVDKFRQWNLEINIHRDRINNGIEGNGKRTDIETAFKDASHPFRIAIVCAMWLTGFDVPSLATLYLDKPLRAHSLMQAIARANRVFEGKNNGLIVDYCGILTHLREALNTFAGNPDEARGEGDPTVDPAQPQENLLNDLQTAIQAVKQFLDSRNASLEAIVNETAFVRIAAISKAKEAANESDETRKRFELLCRKVFNTFKSCINIQSINDYRADRDAIHVVYKSLKSDEEKTDISRILLELQKEINAAIAVTQTNIENNAPYDLSKINFERLKQEFKKDSHPRTTLQNFKQSLGEKVRRMVEQNSSRIDYQKRYEEICDRYNREKDRLIVEQTFEALLDFFQDLDEEEKRATRERLDEETLALFDLLKKPDLTPTEIEKIKQVAAELLKTLKQEKLKINLWYEKDVTRGDVETTILNRLYDEEDGLPSKYEVNEIYEKANIVFLHFMERYKTVPSPYYPPAA